MTRKTYKAYGLALGLLWAYVIAGVFFATVCFPGALSANDEPPARTVTIGFGR